GDAGVAAIQDALDPLRARRRGHLQVGDRREPRPAGGEGADVVVVAGGEGCALVAADEDSGDPVLRSERFVYGDLLSACRATAVSARIAAVEEVDVGVGEIQLH